MTQQNKISNLMEPCRSGHLSCNSRMTGFCAAAAEIANIFACMWNRLYIKSVRYQPLGAAEPWPLRARKSLNDMQYHVACHCVVPQSTRQIVMNALVKKANRWPRAVGLYHYIRSASCMEMGLADNMHNGCNCMCTCFAATAFVLPNFCLLKPRNYIF